LVTDPGNGEGEERAGAFVGNVTKRTSKRPRPTTELTGGSRGGWGPFVFCRPFRASEAGRGPAGSAGECSGRAVATRGFSSCTTLPNPGGTGGAGPTGTHAESPWGPDKKGPEGDGAIFRPPGNLGSGRRTREGVSPGRGTARGGNRKTVFPGGATAGTRGGGGGWFFFVLFGLSRKVFLKSE